MNETTWTRTPQTFNVKDDSTNCNPINLKHTVVILG